ncbi:dorsal-related immunity factor Dif-like [Aphidius gifuensis]|uniref:dorsal-related immunity factor Dif-like n=1 Tax=Aphidius gifuensis TaxID=684658 RepID=UPI001CDC280A|nr:dorsal-related immunity factor Dif-like [Aphidius gifuensis]
MDPFKAGFKHKNSPNLIDMKCVRFCFQATLTSDDGKKIITLDPVVSNVMNSILSKSLRISRLNICSAPASGGKEVTLLCDKVSKHDIKVLFYQQDNDSNIIWKKYAEIVGVHRQIGITIVTPKYDRQLSDVIEVFIKLVRPSDGQSSEPRQFEITPNRLTHQCSGFRNISKAIYPRDVSTMSNLQFG